MEDAPDPSSEAEDQRMLQRLRSGLSAGLGLLSALACAAIAAELIAHVALVIEAQQALTQHTGGPLAPGFRANVRLDPLLVLEAIVLEPLFILSAVGMIAFSRRASYALSLAGMVTYNLAAVGFLTFTWGLGVGGSREHALASVLACLIGLPIAEFGLWTLFRPGERARYLR